MNEQILRRRFALKYNLDLLKSAYEQITRDALLDVGLEYGVKYKDNEWFRNKDKAYRTLRKQREYILFTCIVNFTQCYYMIKDYLKKLYPQYSNEVEDFFSSSDNLNLPRKRIANDLKHNPEHDVDYDFRAVKKEITREGSRLVHTTYMKSSWFYGDQETVAYCDRLYNELEDFLENRIAKGTKKQST